jgi:hypothetical protein
MDPVYLSIVNSVMLLMVAVITYNTNKITKQTEINTNSMKDALVASTKLASHAEGLAQGQAEGKALAAEIALSKVP